MTHVERFLEEQTDTLWALVLTPGPDQACIYGHAFTGPHFHSLDLDGHDTGICVALEDDDDFPAPRKRGDA